MKEYTVIITDEPNDVRTAAKAEINEYVWGGDYRPEAYAQVVFVRDKGFVIRLTAYEKNPKTVYHKNMQPVYTDSCLEFFARYGVSGGYINCELNSVGTLLSAYGEGRGERVPLDKIAGRFPRVQAEKEEDRWSVTVFMPLDIINTVYGKTEIKDGYVFYANAYKCGDGCEFPHYGMYNPVLTKAPDFHRPEYFAKFTVTDKN